MEKTSRGISRASKIAVLVLILIIAVVGAFAAITYPRIILSFPVSLTIGAQVEHREFALPILHSLVQVQVTVTSGAALWTARIQSDDNVLWSHTAPQGGQTTYSSGWTSLASGNYNFTFLTVGLGTLEADITLSSKGGFW